MTPDQNAVRLMQLPLLSTHETPKIPMPYSHIVDSNIPCTVHILRPARPLMLLQFSHASLWSSSDRAWSVPALHGEVDRTWWRRRGWCVRIAGRRAVLEFALRLGIWEAVGEILTKRFVRQERWSASWAWSDNVWHRCLCLWRHCCACVGGKRGWCLVVRAHRISSWKKY